jgi:hypothetical protein
LYSTAHDPVPPVIVIVADPVPLPLHDPEDVIATPSPELAVAATGKVLPNAADAGAWVVTVMLCSAIVVREISMSAARLLIVHVVSVVALQPVPQELILVPGGTVAVRTTVVVLRIVPVQVPVTVPPFQMQSTPPAFPWTRRL